MALNNFDDNSKYYTILPGRAMDKPASEFYLLRIKNYLNGKFNDDLDINHSGPLFLS